MASWELLPEESRLGLVEDLSDHSILWLDAKPLQDNVLQQMFDKTEFADYTEGGFGKK